MFELNFQEKMLLMKLIEQESIAKEFVISPDLRSAYQKIQKALSDEAFNKVAAND